MHRSTATHCDLFCSILFSTIYVTVFTIFLPDFLSVCPSYLSICLSVHPLLGCLSILSVNLSICLICQFVCLSVYLSICLVPVCLSDPSTSCLFVCLSDKSFFLFLLNFNLIFNFEFVFFPPA